MLQSYSKILAEKNSYQTNLEPKNNWFGPTFSLYSRLARIVIWSNRQASKGIYNDYAWVQSSLDVLRALELSGVKISIDGMDNLQNFDGPAVIISNHMGMMETMIPVAIIQPVRRFVYIIKQELATYPLFGKVAMARDPIVVGRTNPREDLQLVMDEGTKRLQAGKSVLIFPQRTRSLVFNLKEFNTLGVKLAKRNNVPVVPMAVLTDAWSNGKKLKDFGKIDTSKPAYFSFGKAITIESKGQDEHEQVLNFISSKLTEWGRSELIKID